MFKDISTTAPFPKTLVVRNREGGMIWQIYHVDNNAQAIYLAENAEDNGFQGVTLEDYRKDDEETFPNWRMESARYFVGLLPDHLVLKEDVTDLPTEQDYPDYGPEYDSAGFPSQEWAIDHNTDDYIVDVNPHPDYVVASTALGLAETYVFGATEEGSIIVWLELASKASRYGDTDWKDKDATVAQLNTNDHEYQFVKHIEIDSSDVTQSLYKKILKESK